MNSSSTNHGELELLGETKVDSQDLDQIKYIENEFEKLIKNKNYFDAYMFLSQIPEASRLESFIVEKSKILIEKMSIERKVKNWNSQKTINVLNEVEKLIDQECFEKAKEKLLIILNYEYEQTEALINYSVVNILQKDYKNAIRVMVAILKIDPNNAITIENMKYVLEQNIDEKSFISESLEEIKYESILCPFCNSHEAEVFRTSADIVKCRECETVYLRRRLKKEHMYQLYQTYADGDSHMSLPKTKEEVLNSGLRRNYWMKEILDYKKEKGIFLDIGCGWGAFLDNARANGFVPRGIEMTRKCVNFANDHLKIEVSNDQFEDTQFENNSISVITMNHVFEHLPYPLTALNKIFRILEPDGLFCGIVPNIESFLSSVFVEEWYWLDPNYHYVHYSPLTLQKQLERAGFKVEKLYTITGDYGIENVAEEVKKQFKIDTRQEIEKLISLFEEKLIGEEIRFIARKK